MHIKSLGLIFIIHFGFSHESVIQQEVVQWDTANAKCRDSYKIMLPGRKYKENEVLKQLSNDQAIWLNSYRLVVADSVEDGMNRVNTLRVDFTKPGTENLFLCEKEGKFYNVSRKQSKPSEKDACQLDGAILATVKYEEDIKNIFDILEADKHYRLKNINFQDGLFKQCQLGRKEKNTMKVTFTDCTEAHSFICLAGEDLLPLVTVKLARKDEIGKHNITLPITTPESSTFSSKPFFVSSHAVMPSELALTAPVVETMSEATILSLSFALSSSVTEISSSDALSSSEFALTSPKTELFSSDAISSSEFELSSTVTEISSSDALSSSEFALTSPKTELFLSDANSSSEFELSSPVTEISSSAAVSSSELIWYVTEIASKDAELFLGFTSISPITEISSVEDIKRSQEIPLEEVLPEAPLTIYQTLSTPRISDHTQSAIHTVDTTEIIQQTSSQQGEMTLQPSDVLHVSLQTSYLMQPSLHTGDLTQSSLLISDSTQSTVQTDTLPELSVQYVYERMLQQEVLETTSHDPATSSKLLETHVTSASLGIVQETIPFENVEPINSETVVASEFTSDGDIHESKLLVEKPPTKTETYFGTEDITKSSLLLLHNLYPSSAFTVSSADLSLSSAVISIVDGAHSISLDNSLNIGVNYENSKLPKMYSWKMSEKVEYTTSSSLYLMPLSVESPKTATYANYDEDMNDDDDDTNSKDKMVLIVSTPVQHQTQSSMINHTTDEIVHKTDYIRHTLDDITVVTDTKSETELPKSSVTFSSKYMYDKVHTSSVKHIYFTESNEIEDDKTTPFISDLDSKSDKDWGNKDNDVYIVSSTQYPKDHLDGNVDTNVAETSLQGEKQNTSEGMETALWVAFAVIVVVILVSLVIALFLYRRRRNQQKSIEITELTSSTNNDAAVLRDKQSVSPSQMDRPQPQGETATFKDAAYEI